MDSGLARKGSRPGMTTIALISMDCRVTKREDALRAFARQ
jgi:hypothetical protein